jgi:hypothetical protein
MRIPPTYFKLLRVYKKYKRPVITREVAGLSKKKAYEVYIDYQPYGNLLSNTRTSLENLVKKGLAVRIIKNHRVYYKPILRVKK